MEQKTPLTAAAASGCGRGGRRDPPPRPPPQLPPPPAARTPRARARRASPAPTSFPNCPALPAAPGRRLPTCARAIPPPKSCSRPSAPQDAPADPPARAPPPGGSAPFASAVQSGLTRGAEPASSEAPVAESRAAAPALRGAVVPLQRSLGIQNLRWREGGTVAAFLGSSRWGPNRLPLPASPGAVAGWAFPQPSTWGLHALTVEVAGDGSACSFVIIAVNLPCPPVEPLASNAPLVGAGRPARERPPCERAPVLGGQERLASENLALGAPSPPVPGAVLRGPAGPRLRSPLRKAPRSECGARGRGGAAPAGSAGRLRGGRSARDGTAGCPLPTPGEGRSR